MRGALYSGGDFPFTISGSRTWDGSQTFQGTANQSTPAASFRAVSGMTGNLLEFYNAAGTRVAYFDQAGNFTTTGAATQFQSSAVTQQTATAIAFQVKRFSSGATGDLQQWQDENGNVLLKVTASGSLQSASGGLSVSSLGVGTSTPNAPVQVASAAAATANYGTLSVGAGPFNGTSAGHFVGSANGTILALNAASGFGGDLADLQLAGSSLFKVDIAGNTTQAGSAVVAGQSITLTNGTAYVDFGVGTASLPQSNSLTGFRVRLYGNNGNYNDYGIGVAASEQWYNAGGGSHAFLVGGTQTALLQLPGTTERSGSANLILKRTVATQAQGISFSGGVAYDAAILRAANDDTLRFGFDSGGSFTERLLLNANGLLVVDAANSNSGAGGAGLYFTTSLTESIQSKRTVGGNQNGIDIYVGNAVRAAVSNGGGVFLGGTTTAATLAVRPDSTAVSLGSGAWARGDGAGGLVINPNGSGQLWFAQDVKNQSNFGGAVVVSGGLQTQNSGISTTGGGVISGSGNISAAGELSGATLAVSGASALAGATFSATATFNAATGVNINANGGLTFNNQSIFGSGVTDASKAIRIFVNGSAYWLKLYS